MKRLIGQMQAKRGIAVALINPHLDRVCIVGAGGTGKTTLLETIISYFPKKDTVIIPAHVTTEKLLGEKNIHSFMQGKNQENNSLLYQAKVVITDQFTLMSESSQRLLVQLLKNREIQLQQHSHFSNGSQRAKWFYCLDQENQDKSMVKHAKVCVPLLPVFDRVERRNILLSVVHSEPEYGKEEIEKAKQRLSYVRASDEMLRLAVEVVLSSGCENQEADIDLIETARALAALDSEESVQSKHIQEAARYTVSHRMSERQESSLPEDSEQKASGETPENSSQDQDDSPANKESMLPDYDNYNQETSYESLLHEESLNNETVGDDYEDEVDQILTSLNVQSDLLFQNKHNSARGMNGKHQEGVIGGNGRMLRAVSRPTEAISLYHTLTAAAPYMQIRVPREGLALAIQKEDIRYKLKEKQQGYTILFLVDASRSIAAKQQMRMVKGAMMELLRQAYQKRDRIGLVTFQKTGAEEVLSFTNNFAVARRELEEIPTGGKTPLAAGLEKALQLCEKERRMQNNQATPYIVIMTDGHANETLKPGGTAAQARSEAYKTARRIAQKQYPVLVIDTKGGSNKFGLAEKLAAVIGGEYISLDVLIDENIVKTVQSRLRSKSRKK